MSAEPGQASLAQKWSRYRPSQAGLVSATVGAALLLLFFANWAAYRSQPQRVAWSDYMQWPQYAAALVLWLMICVMTYWLVKMWHEELPADDGAIESAWQAGLKSLQARGKNLQQMPLFVVLGARSRQHQQELMTQSGLHMLDAIVPAEADAPIHWAFTEQGIWLFVQSAGTYSQLANSPSANSPSAQPGLDAWPDWNVEESTTHTLLNDPMDDHIDQLAGKIFDAKPTRATLVAHDASLGVQSVPAKTASAMSAMQVNEQGPVSSLLVDEATSTSHAKADVVCEQSVVEKMDGLEELIDQASQEKSIASEAKSGPNPQPAAPQPATSPPAWQTELALQAAAQPTALSSTEITRQQHALREVCRRLRSQRGPIAPANGVVSIAPCDQLMSGCVRASELGLALHSDLQIMQDTWQLQTPTSIIVDGLEHLPGASELVRRGGPEQARNECLGAAYPIRHQPEKPVLDRHCQMVIGQVESRVYRYLSSAGGLQQVGNHQLFQTLIACRGRLLPALQTFVGNAVGLEFQGQPSYESSLFAGLHFMASGRKVTEQAWGKAAFAQVLSAQNFLRWTSERLRSDQRHKLLISILKAICLVLLVCLIAAAWVVG